MTAPILQIGALHKRFQSRQVLCHIDLNILPGEVVVLIGASGSGKTSLLRCINLLTAPDHGSISIDGEQIFLTTPDGIDQLKLTSGQINKIRAKTGMVFQQFNLFPHMSVLRNIIEAPIIVKGMNAKQAESEARQLLDQMGLSEHINKHPAQISGGQQQRVAIARALAMKPKIMLFDEPTSALDPELVGEVLKAILELARSGMTMVVVTHELGFAFEIADRVLYLDEGSILADGSPRQVLLQPEHPRLRSFVGRFHESAKMLRPFFEEGLQPLNTPEMPS